jgi:hypothetical protein
MLALLLAASMTNASPLADSGPLSLRPIEQRLELELNPARRMWSGSLLATMAVEGTGRRFELRLEGPTVSRVEMTDRGGRLELTWGMRGDSLLLIEASRPILNGRASLNVAFDDEWAAAGRGVSRDSTRGLARLALGERIAFPAWPGPPVATRWTLLVHAPARCEVRASGRRTGIDEAPGWRTWTFRTAHAIRGDSLHVTVRRAAAKRR